MVQDAGGSVDAAADAQLVGDAGVTPTPCPTSSLNAGDHMQTLQHQGRSRSYLVHVPKSYKGDKPVALVLDLHGYSRTGSSQKGASGWDALADREGIVVAYPDGVSSSWNVGGCCGTAGSSNVDDVGFARALVQKLAGQLCLDAKRVYASGVSNGAGMSARLGCDAADVFAGVSLVSSDLRTMPCQPKRPVTEIAFRGTADSLEPYEGGLVGPPGMQFQSPGARGSFELWKNINRCTGTPINTADICETYNQCAEGVEVTLCTMQGVGHSPYQNSLDLDIARSSWEAFQRVPAR
ncbi:MAG TPA: PHB depolymerase family esterase [Polyangiales bacterium]